MQQRLLVLFALVTLLACGGNGTDGATGTTGGSQTIAQACTDLCGLRASCSGSDSCEADCRASLPESCAAKTAALADCIATVPESERCGEVPPSCADAAAAVTACPSTAVGAQPPAEAALGVPCATSDDCGGTLECMSASMIASGKFVCTRACDVDADCPANALCLLFDANDGHYCARLCETDADCDGTGVSCIVGGERIAGRKLCGR